MGFWNETCMMTRLPILYEEPAVGLLIAPRKDPLGCTYCDDMWSPAVLPMSGSYDAYGRLENVRHSNALERSLRDASLSVKRPDGAYGPVLPSKTGWNDTVRAVMDAAHNGTLFTGMNGSAMPIRLVLIKRKFYNMAVKVRRAYPADWDSSAKSRFRSRLLPGLQSIMTSEADLLTELASFYNFLNLARIAIQPTTGSGYQTEMEQRELLDFYDEMLECARDMHAAR